MSTGYSWEGIRQVHVTLLGARHVPERLWGLLLGALYQVLDLYLLPFSAVWHCCDYHTGCDFLVLIKFNVGAQAFIYGVFQLMRYLWPQPWPHSIWPRPHIFRASTSAALFPGHVSSLVFLCMKQWNASTLLCHTWESWHRPPTATRWKERLISCVSSSRLPIQVTYLPVYDMLCSLQQIHMSEHAANMTVFTCIQLWIARSVFFRYFLFRI